MSRQNPRSCQEFQDPRYFQYIQDEIQDLTIQEIQDVKIKRKIFPRYSRIQDFPEILARYLRSQTLGSFQLQFSLVVFFSFQSIIQSIFSVDSAASVQ